MQHLPTTAPGATVDTATMRAIVAGYCRPYGAPPMDGTTAPAAPAGGDGGTGGAGTATIAAPIVTAVGQAPAPVTPAAPAPPAPAPAPNVLFAPPAPPTTGTAAPDTTLPGTPPAQGGPPAGTTAPAGPVDERPLDQFDPEIRGYIERLRKENGDNRVKAKTAEDAATQQMQGFLDKMAAAFGLTAEETAEIPPEVKAEQLAEQLGAAQNDHRAALVELAVWKGAAAHDADPGRLTDSRRFINAVSKLDPTAADFETQLTAAIGAAVTADQSLKRTPGPAPASPPPVPSGGEFAGGPRTGETGPQTVDDFRDVFKKSRPR
jgi:hypothetical protein